MMQVHPVADDERHSKIEQALRKSEERFRQVVEFAPYAMVMVDDAGRIEMINAEAERVFGYQRGELLGQGIEVLVPVRFRARHPGMRGMFFADPHSRPMGAGRELFGLRKDGSEFPVEIGLNPIEIGEGLRVLSAIIDISDRKAKEERIRSTLNEKELLLAEIHHRVKNNLQIIDGLLHLQASRLSDPFVLEVLRDSQNRVRSMALIHQTLYQSNDFSSVNLGGFFDSLVPTLVASYRTGSGQIAVSIDAEDVALPINQAVPCGLIVNELISNALKHAFPTGRRGRIEVTAAMAAGGHVRLSVADTGVGLPNSVDTRQTETLGLQLVTLLAGQLDAEMAIHRVDPTRFTLTFPIQK